MALILLGIGLFIAGAFAITQLDFLSMLFCYGFGIFCFIMGWRKFSLTKQQDQTPPPPIYKPSAQNIEQKPLVIDTSPVQKPIKEPEPPKRKVSYHKTINVAGVTFDCKYPNGFYDRQDVIHASEYGDKLILEEYKYKGAPAFLIINERLGADIGNVPAWAVDKIKQMSEKYNFEGEFETIDFFEKEGRTSECIYFCKVRLNGYKKETTKKASGFQTARFSDMS